MQNKIEKSNTQKIKESLDKRHKRESAFRIKGKLAIAFSFLMLLFFISDICIKATPALTQHWIKVDLNFDISFDKNFLELDKKEALEKLNYRSVIKRSLYQMFPDVTGRKDKRELFKLLSSDAEFRLEAILKGSPNLLDTKASIWLLADDDVDLFLKKPFIHNKGVGRISDRQAVWLHSLYEKDSIEKRFNTTFFTNSDSREPELAGVKGALIGTILTMLVTLAISFPIGVAAALYLEEFAPKNRWTDIIEVNINNLAAVPSIVFGLLGLAVLINVFGLPRSSPLIGGVVLSLMTLPTIIIASRSSIKAVPNSIREAAIGLGASKMQVTLDHVLPLAIPGILTGAIIGLAQALGETAPLLMIGMIAFIVDIPSGITDAATVLPVQIFLWADSPEHAFLAKTSAAILVLLIFLLMMNFSATCLRRKFEKINFNI